MIDKKIGAPDDHFKDVNRSLSFLRKDERFCDLAFVCHPPESATGSSKAKKPKRVYAHQAVFQPHSELIRNLVDIAHQKQLSDTIIITLDDVDELAVEKLIDYLYLGQTTVNEKLEKSLNDLVKRLGLEIKLDPSPISESSSENEVVEVPEKKSASPAKRGRKPGPSNKKVARSPRKSHVDSDDDGEAKESDGEEIEKLKADAVNKTTSVDLEHIENSSDKDAKKYYKKALNPLFENSSPAASPTPSNAKNAPQKRRLPEVDKKLTSKAPKKARQEDDEETSDGDAEAISARKKEIESVTSATADSSPKPVDLDSDSDSDANTKRNKPGPKRKKAGPVSSKAATPTSTSKTSSDKKSASKKGSSSIENMFATESVQYCGFCGKIFVGNDAHSRHLAEVHGEENGKPDPESDKNESESESPKRVERGRKPGPARKAGPASKKPAPSPKKVEKSVVSETEEVKQSEGESPKKKIGPKSKSKPGPARSKSSPSSNREGISTGRKKSIVISSDDEDKNDEKAKKKKSEDDGKKKGEKKKQSVIEKSSSDSHAFLDIPTSDDEDEKTAKTPKSPPTAKKPKIRISLSGGAEGGSSGKKTKPGRPSLSAIADSPSGGGALRKCRLCPEVFDKAHNLKNHIINHFKNELYARLPKCAPFLCPQCQHPSRDKVTLVRHYAFAHKIIYEYCTEADLVGERADGGEVKSRSSSKSGPASSKKSGPASSKKSEKSDDKKKSKEAVSSDSDSDDFVSSAKPNGTKKSDDKKDVDKSDDDDDEKTFKVAPIRFSDSESDTELLNKSANAAIKSFDELFGDDKDDAEEKGKTDENVVKDD